MPHSSQFPEAEAPIDRFQIYRSLLLPLASIMQGKKHHPEGDVLYHLLQCYVLAADEFPYDEEIQLAALLRDVSKGLDANDTSDRDLRHWKGTSQLARHG